MTQNTEFILRGKALGGFVFEDIWHRGLSIGTEIRFHERLSFVADIVHFRWKLETEVYQPPDYANYDEYALKDARNYLAMELRYYPKFLTFDGGNVRIYLNVFTKIGKRHLFVDDMYPMSQDLVYHINSSLFDTGSSLGLQVGENFGADLNIGAAYRNESMNEDIYNENGPPTFTSGVDNDRWRGNIRFSFIYNFSY